MSLVQHLAVDIGVLVSKMEESIEALIQASLKTAQDHSQRILAASLGTKFLARRVQERDFHRNVISGAYFTADVEAAHDPELACMHRDGHCRKAVMWYVHHLPESMKEVIRDRASLHLADLSQSLVGETTCRVRSGPSRRRSLAQADTLSCTQPLVLISLRCEAVG